MKDIQIISLAYEVVNMVQELNFSLEEALEEIQIVLEDEYKKELLEEVDEAICYYYEHVLSDILTEIKKVVQLNMSLILN
jgi:hypothetical protein